MFGLFAAIMVWFLLELWVAEISVEVGNGTLAFTKRLLGPGRSRSFMRDQITAMRPSERDHHPDEPVPDGRESRHAGGNSLVPGAAEDVATPTGRGSLGLDPHRCELSGPVVRARLIDLGRLDLQIGIAVVGLEHRYFELGGEVHPGHLGLGRQLPMDRLGGVRIACRSGGEGNGEAHRNRNPLGPEAEGAAPHEGGVLP